MSDRSLARDGRRHLRIALAPGFNLRAEVMGGIAACLAEHTGWQGAIRDIDRWDPRDEGADVRIDGMVCTLTTPQQAERAAAWPFPVVDIYGQHPRPGIPTVTADNRAIGAMAADHLLERGYASLGFAGLPRRTYSREREEAFVARAAQAGVKVHVHNARTAFWREAWSDRVRVLADWLRSLPARTGVMAAADWWAATLLEAAAAAEVAVPGDVAIIGVDNDPMHNSLCVPSLSTVDPDARQRGYRAAEIIVGGRAAGAASVRIPPLHVIGRASTDMYAFEDAAVAAALQFIADHADRPISVGDVAAHLSVSRRSLEQRFWRQAGRTVHQAIWRAHLGHAQHLLRATDLPVLEVALRSGFASHASLTNHFRRHAGMTPTEFRQGSAATGAPRGDGRPGPETRFPNGTPGPTALPPPASGARGPGPIPPRPSRTPVPSTLAESP